ncbi:MAG: hypothetical protein LH605_02590, partial [Microbacteriaceae bacterium]|nr:hypothetical protein [Microbacteriaceae bacterium]
MSQRVDERVGHLAVEPVAVEPMREPVGRRPPRILLLLALVACAIASIPLVYLLVRVGSSGLDDAVTVLGRPRVPLLLLNTVSLAAAVTSTCVLVGVPTAFLLARTRLRLRGM